MRIVRSSVCTSFLLMLACAGLAPSQNATGSIHGTVRDEQRGVIPGATIAITITVSKNT